MSYRAGLLGFGGVRDRVPMLICDGCGLTRTVTKPSGQPFAWLLDRKKAPGWSADFTGDMRKDWCGYCTAARAKAKGGSK